VEQQTDTQAGTNPSRNEQRLWAAYLSGGFGLSVSAMLGLLVPLRANELGIAVGAIGVVVAARSASETVLAVPLSALIARLGTKGAFVLSTGASAVVAAAFTLAEDFWALLLLSAAMGAARALGWVASQTYISGEYDPLNRARDTGRFSFVSNASQMVAPLMVGVAAAAWGYRTAFLVVAAYCALFVVIGLVLAPPRKRRSGDDRVRLRAAAGLFKLPQIQMAMLLTFVRLWLPNIWRPLFPLLLVSVGGASPQLAGAVISSAAAMAMVVNLLTGRLSRLADPDILCTVALALGVVGLAISPFLLSVPAAFLPAVLVGLADGLSLPLLIVLVGEAAPKGQRGLALATRNAVNSFSATLGPLGTGWLVAALGATTAFPVVGGLAAALLGGAVALRRRGPVESAAPPGPRG
jgi:DHA1 family inner membrane transport protein